MSSVQARPWLSYACLLGGMVVVGTYVGLSKPLTAAFPVFVLATLRFAIAALMMAPWIMPRASDLSPAIWRALFIQSFFGNFLFSICMLYGVSLSSAVAAGVIMSTLPAVVALLSRAFLKEKLSPQTIAAIFISILGILILQWASNQSLSGSNQSIETNANYSNSNLAIVGNLLLFAAVVCEAIYVVVGKRLSSSLTAKHNSALINLIGLALMLPLGIWQFATTATFSAGQVSVGIWSLLVFYAFAASIGSTWLWMTGLKKIPASQAGVFTIGLPIAAVLVGVFLLNEPVTIFHGVAFACCLIALLLVTLQRFPSFK